MSQYFIWLGVNHLSLCDYPPISGFYAGYRYNVAFIDIDGVSLLSLTSSSLDMLNLMRQLLLRTYATKYTAQKKIRVKQLFTN